MPAALALGFRPRVLNNTIPNTKLNNVKCLAHEADPVC